MLASTGEDERHVGAIMLRLGGQSFGVQWTEIVVKMCPPHRLSIDPPEPRP